MFCYLFENNLGVFVKKVVIWWVRFCFNGIIVREINFMILYKLKGFYKKVGVNFSICRLGFVREVVGILRLGWFFSMRVLFKV